MTGLEVWDVQTCVPLQQQQLLYHGRELRHSDKLSALGIKDEDLLMVMSVAPASAATNAMGLNPDGSALNPAALRQQLQQDSNLIAQLFQPFNEKICGNPIFLAGLDMLRKHQCIIDLKENVLRVGGGEVAVPFLQEKGIPSQFLDEERSAKQASSSGAWGASGSADKNITASPIPASSGGGAARGDVSQQPDFEAKVAKLVELGFRRDAVIQYLKYLDGNAEQAAGYLLGG